MLLLDNPIQRYAWGSRTQLSALLGTPASHDPEAELWIGAHARASSRLSDGRSLRDAIIADPDGMLGGEVQERFGTELPFLLKVLAVESPLSLQAHPDIQQARAGFEREEQANVPLDAPERTYKDRNHKPELLCALTHFRALSGFRPRLESAALFDLLDVGGGEIARKLRASDAGLREVFVGLWSLGPAQQAELGSAVVESCARVADRAPPFEASLRCAIDLWRQYPNDIGVVASLLLNHVTLAPLEAIYLDAGSLHAYLSGMGVEIMANSDNVLRGGLTPKHVDVPELIKILRFESDPARTAPQRAGLTGEIIYDTPAPDFQLSRIDLEPERYVDAMSRGPEILLCISGAAQIEVAVLSDSAPAHLAPRALRRGQACFLPASCSGYRMRGTARVFRATVG